MLKGQKQPQLHLKKKKKKKKKLNVWGDSHPYKPMLESYILLQILSTGHMDCRYFVT